MTRSPTSTRSSAASITIRAEAVETEAQLWRHDARQAGKPGTLIDAIAPEGPAAVRPSFKFDLPDTGLTELEVRLTVDDALALDNRAFTVVGNPRKAQVLVVTPGNRYLVDTLQTPDGRRAGRRHRRHARRGEERPLRPRPPRGPLRPGDRRPLSAPRRPPRRTPSTSASCPPARPTRSRKPIDEPGDPRLGRRPTR